MNEAQMLAAIRGESWDSEARAVYQDWLEEREPDRSAIFRADRTLARCIEEGEGGVQAWQALRKLWRPGPWSDDAMIRYRVVLDSTGSRKILTIKEVRLLTGTGLREAKALCDRPSELFDGLDGMAAFALRMRFRRTLGATVLLEPTLPRDACGSRYRCRVGTHGGLTVLDAYKLWLDQHLVGNELDIRVER